ncbi:3-hydroxyisobutyrate dehydrogenase [Paenibacillus sp. yr247]|uniref:NAD(P)-dependent oxidoreductase n=1 Tax=Paenibacillus sp. yr247 TaxID=1761880 RepID=UPI0008898A73|nr:NAD(P)-dependent oxidoreductase [Paenibacillus sp. yr247]SDO48254.1 3-hydroxyisobutyrate dehydrogenase [Paenibacillus sp. yr247]
MKVGFVGLGNMGFPMAQNILKAGHELVVYNRTASKADPLILQGAKFCATPAEVAREAGIVLSMLADDTAAEEVVFGANGLLEGLPEGGIHVSTSTISIDLAKRMAEAHQAHGQQCVSANVLGRPDAAEAAELRVMVAGPAKAREKVWPVLEALGKNIFVVGDEVQMANVVKLANNFLIIAMLEALSEALVLVRKHGVDPGQFLEVANSFFRSPIYQNYGRIINERLFEPAGFKMKLGLKDVKLMLQAAEAVSTPLPIADLVRNHFLEGISRGWGDLEWAALIKSLESDAGLD